MKLASYSLKQHYPPNQQLYVVGPPTTDNWRPTKRGKFTYITCTSQPHGRSGMAPYAKSVPHCRECLRRQLYQIEKDLSVTLEPIPPYSSKSADLGHVRRTSKKAETTSVTKTKSLLRLGQRDTSITFYS